MTDDQDPLDDAPDPTEDTPEDESQDTAEDDADTGLTDWTPKDRREATQKVSQMGRELAQARHELDLLRGGSTPDGGDDAEDDGGDEEPSDYQGRLERQSWTLAEQIYGPEAVAAYDKAFYPRYSKAETPADYIAALEAYHRARSGGADPAAAVAATGDAKPSRIEAIQPRVDSNRSDRGPDSDDLIAEARKSGKLSDFTGAVATAFGYGPSKR